MTAPPEATDTRAIDLQLARLHLRLGSLALARAELETLAGRDALDDDGLVDLAEVRWRTGDVAGGGEAAHAVLREGEEGPLLALVVAAEAAMALGRPTEARRLAGRAMILAGNGIDAVFAGMPRAVVWPSDPAAIPPAAAMLFDVPAVGPSSVPVDPDAEPGLAAPPIDRATLGLWDIEDLAGPDVSVDDASPDLPSGPEELDRGQIALDAGRTAEAAVHLSLVLRVSPVLAPAVLDVVADDRSPELAFVRGDAYRLVGRELEARRAFAQAVRPVPRSAAESPPEPDTPPEGDPA